jgi:hypothetical protein
MILYAGLETFMTVNIQTAAFRVMTQVGSTVPEEHTAFNYATNMNFLHSS